LTTTNSQPTTIAPALYRLGAILVSILLLVLLIVVAGESPLSVVAALWNGAFGTFDQMGRVISTLSILLLCASGLVFTFTAGLYNLGIEGQVTVGAIVATWALRSFGATDPAPGTTQVAVIGLSVLAGAVGGMLWGLMAGLLNVYGKVSEIFAGLGLNFVAQGLAIFLIFGPWKRPGVASMSGTEPFNESLWLSTFGKTEATPVGIALAVIAAVLTVIIIRGTHFGLRLRAVGRNLRASYILGIPATRQLLSSFAICGLMAGIAGAIQVAGNYHRLIPTISGSLGFLSLLVVMLANFNALFVIPIAIFFSTVTVGSLQLPLVLQKVDSSLSGVIQGMLVLFALIGRGLAEVKGKSK
jgi:general nucleoside transport system permease protein